MKRALLFTLIILPVLAIAQTVTLHVQLNGKTRYPDNNRWLGVLNVQCADKARQVTLEARDAGKDVKVSLSEEQTAGKQITVTQAWKLHGYKLAEIRQNALDDWTVVYDADKKSEYQYLWFHDDPKPYRIPAIATLGNGRILAVNDHRPCGSDIGYGRVDQVQRIGNKKGTKWSAGSFIIQGDYDPNGVRDDGFGDPALVVDRETGTVMLLWVCGHTICWYGNYPDGEPNPVARIYSQDNGKTWGNALSGKHRPAPQGCLASWDDITEQFYGGFAKRGEPEFDRCRVQSLFIGSGKLTQSRKIKVGTHYRVYAPVWTRNNGNRVLYTDDFGQTWNVLGSKQELPCPGGDEPKCEELPDGSVLLSSRKGGGRYFNIYKYTDERTAQGSWSQPVDSRNAQDGIACGTNSTNGEIMIVNARNKQGVKRTLALQSLPTGNQRSDVKIYWKDITEASSYASPMAFAAGWNQNPYQVSNTGSAYSTMTLQKDGRIGFYYEEEPGWYSMVYVPLSISQITNGEYK